MNITTPQKSTETFLGGKKHYSFPHTLQTAAVIVQVFEMPSFDEIEVTVKRQINVVAIETETALPAHKYYQIVIIG